MINFESHINNYLNSIKDCDIKKAMIYAMQGGKRFRPRIIFSIVSGFGLNEEIAYDAAMALEFIQTYSLIHDDLPGMDNDDMRRGKPSLHKAFREDIAIITGDEMLTEAFGIIADSKLYDDACKINLISSLAKYSGLDGMVYGQLLDITNNSKTVNKEKLFEIQDNKTGGLFKIACLFAMYISGKNNKDYFIEIGTRIGQIFQNQDDLFDLIKTEEEMGKLHTDIRNDKGTALSIYTLNELKELIDDEFEQLNLLLDKAEFDPTDLKKLLEALRNR